MSADKSIGEYIDEAISDVTERLIDLGRSDYDKFCANHGIKFEKSNREIYAVAYMLGMIRVIDRLEDKLPDDFYETIFKEIK